MSGGQGRGSSSRQGWAGPSRTGRDGRDGRGDSSRRGRSQPPPGGGSSQTMLIVGGVVGAAALVVGLVLLLGDSSPGGSRRRSRGRAPVPSGAITRAEALLLKREGIAEYRAGNSLYRQAGAFGSPGYAQKCGEAREHLYRALDCMNKAETVLRNDLELRESARQCSIILAACFKVPVSPH